MKESAKKKRGDDEYQVTNVALKLTNFWKNVDTTWGVSPGFYTPSDMLTARVSCDTDT